MVSHSVSGSLSITAAGVGRVLDLTDGRLTTIALTCAGTPIELARALPDFSVTVGWEMLQFRRPLLSPVTLLSSDFDVVDVSSADGTAASIRLAHPSLGLDVDVCYAVDEATATLTKSLALTVSGREPLRIDRVVTEHLQPSETEIRKAGHGQPLLGRAWWVGIIHPEGFTAWDGTVARVGIDHLGVAQPGATVRVPTTVIGFSNPGDSRAAFLSYIDRVRARPVRRWVSLNTWYDLQHDDMNQQGVSDRLRRFERIMTCDRSTPPDVYVIDDHWDDRRSGWRVDPTKFPDGFAEVRRVAAGTAMDLGLWFGPTGGYGDESTERVEWYRENGYEVSANGRYLCLGGARYRRLFIDQLLAHVRAAGLRYLKLDGVSFDCLDPSHGHPSGADSRTAMVDALIDVLAAVRTASPDIFLSVTTGMWLSPWWLVWADAVFIGGEDFGWDSGFPAVEERDAATTYRDGVIYDDFVVGADVFPFSSLMSVGVIKGDLLRLGGKDEAREAWRHDVIMEVSRGIMQTELYFAPDALSIDEWDDVCSALRWARANDDVLLQHTEMILGDPRRGEPYGYAHRTADRSIVTVRNPSLQPARVAVDLARWAPSGVRDTVWSEVYPGRRDMGGGAGGAPVDLGPNEVVMLIGGSAAAGSPTEISRKVPAPSTNPVVAAETIDAGTVRIRLSGLLPASGDSVVLVATDLPHGVDVEWTHASTDRARRSTGAGWSVLMVPADGGGLTIDAHATGAEADADVEAEVTAWLWRPLPLDQDGGSDGPFPDQDHRIDARRVWSGRLQWSRS